MLPRRGKDKLKTKGSRCVWGKERRCAAMRCDATGGCWLAAVGGSGKGPLQAKGRPGVGSAVLSAREKRRVASAGKGKQKSQNTGLLGGWIGRCVQARRGILACREVCRAALDGLSMKTSCFGDAQPSLSMESPSAVVIENGLTTSRGRPVQACSKT